MMKKVELIQKNKQKMIVTIDTIKHEIDIQLILKYQLVAEKEITLESYQQLIFEQTLIDFDQMAVKKLKKMMTVKELTLYLKEKGATQQIISQLVDKYIKYKYLDDLAYAKQYVLSKQYSEGPEKLKYSLSQKGISENIIQLVFVNYHEKKNLEITFLKKVKTLKNKSLNQQKQTVFQYFKLKGFSEGLIRFMIEDHYKDIQIDESVLIIKTFKTQYEKHIKKHPKNIAFQKALEKCYHKGYQYEQISQTILEKKDDYL